MSIGNLRDQGNKGNNFPYQLANLKSLAELLDCCSASGVTLTQILQTLQDSNDYEAKLVIDTCDNNKVYLEVRVWDPTPPPGSWGPITYYLPGSTTPVVPPGASTPGCLVYPDNGTILASILSELQSQTTLLTDIETNTGDTVTNTTGSVRTTNFLRPTGSNGSISAGAYSMSFASVGTANALVGGIDLKPGETINFDAGAINNTLGAVAYDTSTNAGAELIIIWLT